MPWCTVNSKKKCGNTAHCSTELDVRIRNICYTTHYRESLRFGEHSKVLERSVLCSHCRSSWFYWFCAVFNTLYKNWDISVDCRDVICWHFILAIVRDFDVNVKPLGLIFRINLQAQIKKKKKKILQTKWSPPWVDTRFLQKEKSSNMKLLTTKFYYYIQSGSRF